MTTLTKTNSIHRSPLRRGLLLIPLAFVCFALTPAARAVSPAPDGGYPGGNTAEGLNALLNLTTGSGNTALGANALSHNATASSNTAVGLDALYRNTTGSSNTAIGYQALLSNTGGGFNTANGSFALFSLTTGSLNTANGYQALFSNTTGRQNTATGYAALNRNTSDANTANGYAALAFNTTGFENTAIGAQALNSSTIGDFNTAIGEEALKNITTGLNNIALGESAGLNHTGDDGQNIDIGNTGVAGDNRTTRIGSSSLRAFIAGISGATASGGVAVFVNSSGQLGTMTSSARFKDDIKPMDKASEAILALKPVTFRYKPELDPEGIPQFGLVAEQVEKVNPDLVARDAKGELYTVRYEAVNAMLLNEFLKEHHQVQDLKAIVAEQQKQIKALASGLEKVSAQIETSKPVPQMVSSNQ